MSTANTDLHMQWRQLKDRLARYMVAVGGIGVIMAITLIFVYLLTIVLPLFSGASITKVADYPLPAEGGKTLYLGMEEQAEIAVRVTDQGQVQFLQTTTGKRLKTVQLPLPENTTITSFAAGTPESAVLAIGLSNGLAIVFKYHMDVSFRDDKRMLTPVVQYPLGQEPLLIDWGRHALQTLAIQLDDESVTLVAVTEDHRLMMTVMQKEESMMDDEASWSDPETSVIAQSHNDISFILLDKNQRNLYLANASGELSFYDISDKSEPKLVQHIFLLTGHKQLRSLKLLAGDISLLVGDSQGNVTQWFPVKDAEGRRVLQRIREFSGFNQPVMAIAPEHTRKGFLAVDKSGRVGLFHTTAENTLLVERVSDSAIVKAAIAPRANAMLVEDAQHLYFYTIKNEHPEVSMKALWGKVWYESYPKPDYIWQSSSASNDFEPKLSLVPLSFGTVKAAFYAMLFAIPLAVMGAIFTAQFMSPSMRKVVKPSIEIMEALPTVILGFLAGLWLAPFMEANLPGIFSIMIIMPLGLLLFAYLWQELPDRIRHSVPDGWEAALLIPIVAGLGYFCFILSPILEDSFFAGDMPGWLRNELGINYDQRNSLVVGLAMGFAVIPTIFSIAEDAIFAVPKHLVQGSLALGATPWQTLVRVVLLTASPGIFSAMMIGMGRAVGETMIVLMATGNTPIMDFSVFEGMRTLSANIAVEMPESEVDSTHYRVLFLAAVVLFTFTFIFNTVAEVVRQRLRQRYSNL
ncbi:Phosphate transport system permease protein PstC (TC 3.A.1.7.1) [hydrothermal vent metagenome]|uniref:Phosphate transport system permease protein PstC (TC 3.A.1.7.1) n=1 Tax=hydrothermal vent metagenome TaxID=652676 RepID=A0A3B1BZY9_9ZZZZ